MSELERNSRLRIEQVTQAILLLRGQRVILDAELAALYDVTTKRLNEQVKRNTERFPSDFMFRLSRSEVDALNRSQFATGSQRHRNPRFPPFAFTEYGAIMAATILNSSRAVEMSLYVVRAFVRLRELLSSNAELARRLDVGRRMREQRHALAAKIGAQREFLEEPIDAELERHASTKESAW